jgi:hypothetical protein
VTLDRDDEVGEVAVADDAPELLLAATTFPLAMASPA